MGTLRIIQEYPIIHIDLQLFQTVVDLAPEGAGIELILDRLMKPFTDAIGLRAPGFGAYVFDVFQVKIQGKLVALTIATVLAAPVGENA